MLIRSFEPRYGARVKTKLFNSSLKAGPVVSFVLRFGPCANYRGSILGLVLGPVLGPVLKPKLLGPQAEQHSINIYVFWRPNISVEPLNVVFV